MIRKQKITIYSLLLIILFVFVHPISASQQHLICKYEKILNENGNKISEGLASYFLRDFRDIDDIRTLSKNAIDSSKEKTANGESTQDQIYILSLHKNDEGVMDALIKGRALVFDSKIDFIPGVINGELIKKSILYDLALLKKDGESEEFSRLLDGMKNNSSVAFRVTLAQSIRFIENDRLLRLILNDFSKDKRDAIRGAPSGTDYFLRVCDVTAHEFYLKMGLDKKRKLRIPDDDLKLTVLFYDKYQSEKIKQ